MVKLIIFDLDGTLLDTVSSIAHFCNEALKKFGLPVNPEKDYKFFAGDGAKLLVHRALSANNVETEENFENVYKYYMTQYNQNSTYKTTHFEGMPEVLQKIKDRGIAIAIATNKPVPILMPLLPRFFPENFFDFVFGADAGYPLKPDPYCVEFLIEKAKVSKDEVLYVGDTGTDMLTGKGAGVKTVGVLWGFRDEEELKNTGADVIIKSPSELLNLI